MVQTTTSSRAPAASEAQGSFTAERRGEQRYATNDAAEVQVLPLTGLHFRAAVVDISRSGLRLELNKPLTKDMRVEVMITPRKLVIFGVVRYCRPFGEHFRAGVLIEEVVFPKPDNGSHVDDDHLALYVLGRGLTVPELLRLKDHLSHCAGCVSRLARIAVE